MNGSRFAGRTGHKRMVLGAAAALAVLGGAVACGGGQQRTAGQVAAESSACAQIREQIQTGTAVDVGAAQNCDQSEFAALENDRQAARAKGAKPAMRISATCETVNERAADGDPDLDFGLAFHCRQRERFAATVNSVSGLGPADKVTSLCLGARAKRARGETVDAFTDSFCAREEAAAGNPPAGGGAGQGSGGATTAGRRPSRCGPCPGAACCCTTPRSSRCGRRASS